MPVESVYSWLQSETNSMMELSGMRVEVVGMRDGGGGVKRFYQPFPFPSCSGKL